MDQDASVSTSPEMPEEGKKIKEENNFMKFKIDKL